jgi:3-hydroxybutyryl-CoA dehydratase
MSQTPAALTGGFCFQDVNVGQALEGRLTVTEAHVVLAAGIFGDFAPLYVDAEFAKTTRFGARIAHGALVAGIMAGVLSKSFGRYALEVLEQSAEFKAPVYLGDTVATRWRVKKLTPKADLGGGVVVLAGECRTQKDVVAVLGRAALFVSDGRPGPAAGGE